MTRKIVRKDGVITVTGSDDVKDPAEKFKGAGYGSGGFKPDSESTKSEKTEKTDQK